MDLKIKTQYKKSTNNEPFILGEPNFSIEFPEVENKVSHKTFI